MPKMSAFEAKTHFGELLHRVERGEQIVITRHDRPFVLRGGGKFVSEALHRQHERWFRMLRRFATLVVSLGVAALLFARGNLKELTVPLKFIPQEGVHASNPDLQPGLITTTVVVRVEDARNQPDPLVIGQGTGGDDKLFPIHADKSPVEFIHDVVNGVSTQWGLKQETPAARTLTLQITRFFIDESNKAVGSVYGTEVKIAYTLKDAKGNTLATGATSGTAHRYGRAHSPENINEVLSDSLKEAY